jgi:hypothetical protein
LQEEQKLAEASEENELEFTPAVYYFQNYSNFTFRIFQSQM